MEILRRTEASGVPVQIGYPRRFDAAFAAAREAVASGSLGWLHTVRSTTLDPAPPPDAMSAPPAGSSGTAVHDFDAIRYVTGQEVVEVYATGSNQGAAIFADADDVDRRDSAHLGVRCASGRVELRYNARGHDVRLELHGSIDSVAAGLEERWPIRSTEPESPFLVERRTISSWTGLPTPSAPSLRRSPRWSPGHARRPVRSPTRSRLAGSPRPPTCPFTSIVPSAWTTSVQKRSLVDICSRQSRRRSHLLGCAGPGWDPLEHVFGVELDDGLMQATS